MKHKLTAGLIPLVALALAGAPGATLAAEQDAGTAYRLSLADCLRMALENNLDLVSARNDPRISAENVNAEMAGFSTTLSVDPQHVESKGEISNLFSLNERTSDSATVGISRGLRSGMNYTLEFDLERQESVGPFVTQPTTYDAALGLNVSIPLIGTSNGATAGKLATTERLELARGNLEISEAQLQLEAQRVMEEVENAYWNVVAARTALSTRRLQLKRSEDLLELNRKKVEVGTLAPIEITQAEAGVASNEEQVIIAETDLANAEDDLRRLMAVSDNDPVWMMRLDTVDRPDFSPRRIDLESSVRTALANRPELASARQQLRNNELSEKAARARTRPGLSLNAGVTPRGNNFEGVVDIVDGDISISQESKGKFDEAVSEIPDFDNYTWTLGLNFSYQLGNRAAKADYAVAGLNRRKSEVAVENQEQVVRVDVRKAVRSVDSGVKRVDAARKNVELQEKKLEAEQKKFENGMSTSFEVLTFQSDLADAELGLIQAGLDFARALTALERSKGTLLAARGLSLD